jgi:hypothetical protein
MLRILCPPKFVSKTMYLTSLEDRGELIFVTVNNNKLLGSTQEKEQNKQKITKPGQ